MSHARPILAAVLASAASVGGLAGPLAPALHAQVPVTALGLGYPVPPLDARAAALGGTGVGLLGASFSVRNPADLTSFRSPAFSVTVAPEDADIEIGGPFPSTGTGRGRFTVLRAVVPVGPWAFAGGFRNVLDQDWSFGFRDTLVLQTGTFPFEERREHDGGISAIVLSASRQLGPLSLGVGYERLTGGLRQIFTRRFAEGLGAEEGFLAAIQQRARWSYSAWRLRGGMAVELDSLFRIGGAVGWTSDLTATREREIGEEFEPLPSPARRRYDMPLSVDVGASGRPASGLLLAVGGGWTRWSEAARSLRDAGVRDVYWAGAGVEYSGARVLGAPLALRVGARVRDLPFFPPAGSPAAPAGVPAAERQLQEKALTLGAGIDVAGGSAAFDLAAEIGSRGELRTSGVEESFRRFFLTVTLRQ